MAGVSLAAAFSHIFSSFFFLLSFSSYLSTLETKREMKNINVCIWYEFEFIQNHVVSTFEFANRYDRYRGSYINDSVWSHRG